MESLNFNQSIPVPNFESLDSLKEKYKEKLDEILNKKLTVENIGTFANDALDDVVILTKEILEQYESNPGFKTEVNSLETTPTKPVTLDDQAKEDDAFKKLNLPNLQDVLQSIIEVKAKIDEIKRYIEENKIQTGDIMIPPQEGLQVEASAEKGGNFVEKKFVPRLLTLVYLLEQDFDISKDEISVTEGVVNSNMMRKTPYIRVEIDALNRVVYICDEEGNASYVFDTKKLEENNISLEQIDMEDKGDLNELIKTYPGIGRRIYQKSQWRDNVSYLLGKEIQVNQTEVVKVSGQESEFKRERRIFISFDKFKKEVNEAYSQYDGSLGVSVWYQEERKRYKSWPSNPGKKYKNDGWEGFLELVGKEELDFLDFNEFKIQVQNLYPGSSAILDWYDKERKKHKNWPQKPRDTYKNSGWTNWFELVGQERIQFLSFDEFKNEVIKLYPGTGSVEMWYTNEKKMHKNWPGNPASTYENKGWDGLIELIGQKKVTFEDFKREVNEAYSQYDGNLGISVWYGEEKTKHKNWPSAPWDKYKKSGWTSFPELVGEKKIEFISFEQFKNEVMTSYPKSGGIKDWYDKERKNHKNWPSNPQQVYKDKGWKSWAELTNIEKVEFLSLQELRKEVMTLYPKAVGINDWYDKERKKHKNWPSTPARTYKDSGWVNWADLIAEK